MKKIVLILSLIFVISMIYNCGDEIITTDKNIVFPDSNVSYIHQVQPFLDLKCASRGCHNSESKRGDRDMSTYMELFSTSNIGLIIVSNPQKSRIIEILNGNPEHQVYPNFPKGYFIENHVNGMTNWIKEGAKFN